LVTVFAEEEPLTVDLELTEEHLRKKRAELGIGAARVN
jgi:hypothetical protein